MKKPALGIKPRWLWEEDFELGIVIPKDKIEARYKELVETKNIS